MFISCSENFLLVFFGVFLAHASFMCFDWLAKYLDRIWNKIWFFIYHRELHIFVPDILGVWQKIVIFFESCYAIWCECDWCLCPRSGKVICQSHHSSYTIDKFLIRKVWFFFFSSYVHIAYGNCDVGEFFFFFFASTCSGKLWSFSLCWWLLVDHTLFFRNKYILN